LSSPQTGRLRITVQALVHATEDESKVRKAIENLFPASAHGELQFKRTQLRGHYHNPIIRLEAQLKSPELIALSLTDLGNRLPIEERQRLVETLSLRINQKGHLFLRFDKQESYQGRLRFINQGDSLRVIIRFPGRKLSLAELETQCRRFNLI
jgi:RNA binding exosome subunit